MIMPELLLFNDVILSLQKVKPHKIKNINIRVFKLKKKLSSPIQKAL